MSHILRILLAGSLRFALYTRVSDKHKQADKFSLPSQLKEMTSAIEGAGHAVVAALQDTESAYYDGLERSELNKVLKLA